MTTTDNLILLWRANRKSYTTLLFVFTLLILGPGCADKTNEENGNSSYYESSVRLNNGEKWFANPETTTGVNNMLSLLSEWQETTDDSDVLILKSKLENEFKLIFKNCTMTGEAHDQLHNYLMPLKELIDRLGEADPGTSAITMADLEEYLQLYFDYFE